MARFMVPRGMYEIVVGQATSNASRVISSTKNVVKVTPQIQQSAIQQLDSSKQHLLNLVWNDKVALAVVIDMWQKMLQLYPNDTVQHQALHEASTHLFEISS